MHRKGLAGLLVLLMAALMMCTANAAEDISMTVKGPDGTQVITVSTNTDKSFKISKGGEYTFTQSDPDTQVRFNIEAEAKDKEIVIRLNGVNFKPYNTGYYNGDSGISLGTAKSIKIVLEKGTVNRIHGGGSSAIAVGTTVDVIIEGEGTLYATGGATSYYNSYHSRLEYDGAGIFKGTGNNTLTINGGTIYATGSSSAAGIGGSRSQSVTDYGSGGTMTGRGSSNIIINAGTVYAKGYPAIGSTGEEEAKNITINGGRIYAEGSVGCAANGSAEGIEINGGYVEAYANKYNAAIGNGTSKNITINGGIVIAGCGSETDKDGKAAAIGSNSSGTATNITITGGKVIAYTGTGCNPVGSAASFSDTNKISPAAGTTMTVKSGTSKDEILKTTSCTQETLISAVTAGNYFEISEDCKHGGETEIRDAKPATPEEDGYTGDTYCLECGEKIGTGEAIVFICLHNGKTEIRDAAEPTEEKEGYSGDVYCLSCGEKIKAGKKIAKLDPLPKTGDEAALTLWLMLAAASACFLLSYRKSKKA